MAFGVKRKRGPRRPSTAAWRGILEIEARRLEADLARVPQSKRQLPDYRRVEDSLATLRQAIQPPETLVQRMLRWYSGRDVESGWAARAEAREALLGLLDDDALRAQISSLRRGVARYIPADDSRRESFTATLDRIENREQITPADIAQLRAIRRAATEWSDHAQREIRLFRNVLYVTSTVLVVLLLTIAITHAIDPSFIALCADSPAGGPPKCVDGSPSPDAGDVFEIELLGALGGLLSGLIPMARVRRLEGPYPLATAQALVKLFTGAATALLGAILLQGGLLGGVLATSETDVVAFAAFFGFAQQAFTRVLDQRAAEVVTPAPEPPALTDGAQGPSGRPR